MMPTSSLNSNQHLGPPAAPQVVVLPRPVQNPEYTVRTFPNSRRSFNMMKFNTGLNSINAHQWTQATLERENNIKEFKPDEELPKFGAGSEYGREQREEARRKKYGIQVKKYNPEDQPWILKVGGKSGRKYKGIREGGVMENSSLYIFSQGPDGVFEAMPVQEWYNFAPIQRFKALTLEEAEEEFEKRNRTLNYFNVMKKKKAGENDAEEEEEDKSSENKKKKKKKKNSFKLTEMEDWSSDEEEEEEEDSDGEKEEDRKKVKGGKGGKAGAGKAKGKKKKKKKDEDSGGEAMEESDEGDFDDREVDYITNSSSSDEEPEEEKVNREMKGVEDEEGLRKLTTESGDEEEEEDEDKTKEEGGEGEENSTNQAAANHPTTSAAEPKGAKDKVKKEPASSGESTSESSDSDFDDDSHFQSAMFMPKSKKNGADSNDKSSGSSKSSNKDGRGKAVKRKANAQDSTPAAKKVKTEASAAAAKPGPGSSSKQALEVITDEAVRRYLLRKPMTTKDLIQKFRKKVSPDMCKNELVVIIAQTLKRLNPITQKIKDTLYFHVKG